jgi:hypothetical protein
MMLAHISNFVVGRDRRGRWTAVAANGRAGGVFVSRAAALRYARLETGRTPGTVRQASSPVQLPLGRKRLGADAEGLPAWWRHGLSDLGSEEGRRWGLLDIGIATTFALLCVAAGAVLS